MKKAPLNAHVWALQPFSPPPPLSLPALVGHDLMWPWGIQQPSVICDCQDFSCFGWTFAVSVCQICECCTAFSSQVRGIVPSFNLWASHPYVVVYLIPSVFPLSVLCRLWISCFLFGRNRIVQWSPLQTFNILTITKERCLKLLYCCCSC